MYPENARRKAGFFGVFLLKNPIILQHKTGDVMLVAVVYELRIFGTADISAGIAPCRETATDRWIDRIRYFAPDDGYFPPARRKVRLWNGTEQGFCIGVHGAVEQVVGGGVFDTLTKIHD